MDSFAKIFHLLGQWFQFAQFGFIFVFFSNFSGSVNIAAVFKVQENPHCLIVRYSVVSLHKFERTPLEEVQIDYVRTFTKGFTCLLLKFVNECAIAFISYDSQAVDLMYHVSENFLIHPVSVAVYTQTQPTAYFLTFVDG